MNYYDSNHFSHMPHHGNANAHTVQHHREAHQSQNQKFHHPADSPTATYKLGPTSPSINSDALMLRHHQQTQQDQSDQNAYNRQQHTQIENEDGQDPENLDGLVTVTPYWPLIPPEEYFASREDALEFIREHGKVHGYGIAMRRSKGPRFWIQCDRGGKPRPKLVPGISRRRRNTASRRIDCPFSIYGAQTSRGWTIAVENPEHNHVLSKDPRVHSSLRRLSADLIDRIAQMTEAGYKPRKIIKILNAENSNVLIVPTDLYNLRQKFRRDKMKHDHPAIEDGSSGSKAVHIDENTNLSSSTSSASKNSLSSPRSSNTAESILNAGSNSANSPGKLQLLPEHHTIPNIGNLQNISGKEDLEDNTGFNMFMPHHNLARRQQIPDQRRLSEPNPSKRMPYQDDSLANRSNMRHIGDSYWPQQSQRNNSQAQIMPMHYYNGLMSRNQQSSFYPARQMLHRPTTQSQHQPSQPEQQQSPSQQAQTGQQYDYNESSSRMQPIFPMNTINDESYNYSNQYFHPTQILVNQEPQGFLKQNMHQFRTLSPLN